LNPFVYCDKIEIAILIPEQNLVRLAVGWRFSAPRANPLQCIGHRDQKIQPPQPRRHKGDAA